MSESFNRREFIQWGITTGFAAAVMPITSDAITTSAEGIYTENIRIPAGGVSIPGYLAAPKSNGPFPVVLVVHEIFGVHAYIQDVCRRLAKKGFVAVSPYLYAREGDVTTMKDIDQIVSNVVMKVPQTQVWSDLDATLDFLKGFKRADLRRVGITGYCWGGNVVWTYAVHNPKLKAGVAWYGRVAAAMGSGRTPIEMAPELRVPVLGLYGAKDQGISVESLEQMKAVLGKGKSGSEIKIYSDAEHGFHADYRPSYHEKSAVDGWNRTLNWFKKL